MNAAVLIARICLGGLLVLAGALKVNHAADLAVAMAAFRLLPAALVGPLAYGLPWLELLLGAYLIVGLFTRTAAAIACAAFLAYAGAIASAVVRHIPAVCGCFGPNDTGVADWRHVAFDLTCAAAGAFISYGAPGSLALDRKLRRA